MIKVRYVALIEVEDEMPDSYAVLPLTTITERLRGKWIKDAIAVQMSDIFTYDPKIKVTTQLADVVKINKFERSSKQEGFKAAGGTSDTETILLSKTITDEAYDVQRASKR